MANYLFELECRRGDKTTEKRKMKNGGRRVTELSKKSRYSNAFTSRETAGVPHCSPLLKREEHKLFLQLDLLLPDSESLEVSTDESNPSCVTTTDGFTL